MQANLLGFVGFTRQETDVLSKKEAATITEYLRAIFETVGGDRQTLTQTLSDHENDFDDPHETGKSATFLKSVYQVLYQYYCDLSSDPVSYDTFLTMTTSVVWGSFLRRLITDHALFLTASADGATGTLPATVDTGNTDPNAASPLGSFGPVSSIDDFFKDRAATPGWNVLSTTDDLSIIPNHLPPKIYVRPGLPLLVASNDPSKLFLRQQTIDLTGETLPITIGLRLGRGRVAQSQSCDLMTLTLDDGDYTISYDAVEKTLVVSTPSKTVSTTTAVTLPTGVVWVTMDPMQITVAAQGLQDVSVMTQALTDISPKSIRSLTLLQRLCDPSEPVAINALAVFTGMVDHVAVCSQSSYL